MKNSLPDSTNEAQIWLNLKIVEVKSKGNKAFRLILYEGPLGILGT